MKFKCNNCDFTSDGEKCDQHHQGKNLNINLLKCKHCDFTTTISSRLQRHEDISHGTKLFSCTQCDYVTLYSSHLKRHQKSAAHETSRDHNKNQPPKTKSIRQNIRGRQVKVRAENSDGKMTYDKSKTYACDSCDYSSNRLDSLKKHHKAIHDKIKDYKCESCDFSTSHANSFRKHKKGKHDKIKDFKCLQCDYTASVADSIKRHKVAVHDKIQNYKCLQCDYSTRQKVHLKSHIQSAHAVDSNHNSHSAKQSNNDNVLEPTNSELIQVGFKTDNGIATSGKIVHDKSKTYACDSCDYSSNRLDSLKKHHKAIHDKIKDYKCESCDFSTSHIGSFRQHKKAKHDKKRDFKCLLCDYSSSLPASIRRHKAAVHDRIRNFRCLQCDYSASQKVHLKSHVKSIHTSHVIKALSNDKVVPESPSFERYQMKCEDKTDFESDGTGFESPTEDDYGVCSNGIEEILCTQFDSLAISSYKKKTSEQQSREMPDILNTNKFKCNHCDFTSDVLYWCRVKFTQHPKARSTNKTLKCDQCEFSTRFASRLKRHKDTSHAKKQPKRKIFKCEKCDYSTEYPSDLRRHRKALHDRVKDFNCESCDYASSYLSDLNRHTRNVHRETNVATNLVKCDFSTRSSRMKRIKDKVHHSLKREEGSFERAKTTKCLQCEFTAVHPVYLQRHVQTVHLRSCDFKCELCDFATLFPVHLWTHKKKVHGIAESVKCDQCNFCTSNMQKMKRHKKYVHEKMKFKQCPHCDYSTRNLSHLKVHISSVHEKKKSQKCPQCDYVTGYSGNLTRHLNAAHDGQAQDISTIKESSAKLEEFEDQLDVASMFSSDTNKANVELNLDEFLEITLQTQEPEEHNRDLSEGIDMEQINEETQEIQTERLSQELELQFEPLEKQHLQQCDKTKVASITEQTFFTTEENDALHLDSPVNNSSQKSPKELGKKLHDRKRALKCQQTSCTFTGRCPSELKRHQKSVHDKIRDHKCLQCDYAATLAVHLKSHVDNIHAKERKFTCSECDYASSQKSNLLRHMLTHESNPQETSFLKKTLLENVNKSIKCHHPSCTFTCLSPAQMRRHQKNIHNKIKDQKCPHCDYTTSQANHVKRHVNEVHYKVRRFQCALCNYATYRSTSLKQHLRAVHGEISVVFESCNGLLTPGPSEIVQETRCNSPQETNLLKHIETGNNSRELISLHGDDKRSLQCQQPSCTFTYIDPAHLKQHQKSVHDKVRDHKCLQCDYAATQAVHLKRHVDAIHANKRDFKCSECDYAFSQKSHLLRHMKTHGSNPQEPRFLKVSQGDGKWSLQCQQAPCTFTCLYPAEMHRHQKSIQDKIKDHDCPHCDFTCSQGYQVKHHVNEVHFKVRRFQCALCDYATNWNSRLKHHLRTKHDSVAIDSNNENPQTVHETSSSKKCPHCDYSANKTSQLRSHIRTMHGLVKDKKCHLCDYSTSHTSHLKSHIRGVHEKAKPYKCGKCDFSSSYSAGLKRHEKRVHGKVMQHEKLLNIEVNRADLQPCPSQSRETGANEEGRCGKVPETLANMSYGAIFEETLEQAVVEFAGNEEIKKIGPGDIEAQINQQVDGQEGMRRQDEKNGEEFVEDAEMLKAYLLWRGEQEEC